MAEHRLDRAEVRAALDEVTGGRLRWGLSAAGWLSPDTFRWYHGRGVELCSGFGMTEGTGGLTMTPPGEYVEESVGLPLPGVEIGIALSAVVLGALVLGRVRLPLAAAVVVVGETNASTVVVVVLVVVHSPIASDWASASTDSSRSAYAVSGG